VKDVLKTTNINVYLGKSPQLQGTFPILNDEGLLVLPTKRIQANDMFKDTLRDLVTDHVIEITGTGMKVGRQVEDRKDSVCVLYNVADKGFSIYVLKSCPDNLPKHQMKTDGEAIKGNNQKSSRIPVLFEGNTSAAIAAIIRKLPSIFENGRKTTMNTERLAKQPKEAKPKATKPPKTNKMAKVNVDAAPPKPSNVEASTSAKKQKAPVIPFDNTVTVQTKTTKIKAQVPPDDDADDIHFVIGKKTAKAS